MLTPASHATGRPSSPAERARLLHRFAESAFADSSRENRQRARRDIEEAIQLEPGNPEHVLLLGRIDLEGELDAEATACFRRVVQIDPRQAEGWLALGFARKREWLRTLDSLAVLEALAAFDTLTRLRPYSADAWLPLVPLRYEGGDLERAAIAAERAMAGRPHYAESNIAGAYIAYRRGRLGAADSLFRAAIPLLRPDLRRWFEDPGLPGRKAGDPWRGLDPDPTTPENELQLEYWSRVAHALLLFYDPDRPGYDARAEAYVRYGPPARVLANPPDVPAFFRASTGAVSGMPADYPTPILAWYYPEMGMRVVLQDRALHGRYQMRSLRGPDPTALPDPRLMAARGDLASLGGGFMVMPKLPPPSVRLDMRGAVARFEGVNGPRIVGQVETPGTPADLLSSRWVVTDSAGRVVLRGGQALAPAGCDPAAVREAQFAVDLPPGSYRMAVSIHDPQRWRALYETRVAVAPNAATLAASDLVCVCGEPGLGLTNSSLRFDIDTEARHGGTRPLVVYFEIYHLVPDGDGIARFAYDYEVRRTTPDGRPSGPALISLSREDLQPGTLRRQFLSVPTRSLAPGSYALMVRIHDRVANTAVERSAAFVRE